MMAQGLAKRLRLQEAVSGVPGLKVHKQPAMVLTAQALSVRFAYY